MRGAEAPPLPHPHPPRPHPTPWGRSKQLDKSTKDLVTKTDEVEKLKAEVKEAQNSFSLEVMRLGALLKLGGGGGGGGGGGALGSASSSSASADGMMA